MAVAFDNLTLSQRVYEHLRDEILADHLLPGTELSEVALSKKLAISRFFAANVAFHELLCELSGNPKLQEVHHRLEAEIGRFQNRTLALRGSTDDSLAEHRAILAAIRQRDADRAAALTANHIRVPAQRLQAVLRADGPERASGQEPASPAGLWRA